MNFLFCSLRIVLFTTILISVGCQSTTKNMQNFVEDSLDRALNQKNTSYIDPDRLADSKEEALQYAQNIPNENTSQTFPSKGIQPSIPTFRGSVIVINPQKKFLIVDFQGGTAIPPLKTEMEVYRGGQRVGIIRITEPIKAPLASADIVKGTLARGDIVLK